MATDSTVRVGRVYDPTEPSDGARVLVDRLWPRGMTRAAAALDEWCRDVAPSNELRHWYGHVPDRFDEFVARYRAELAEPERAPALERLTALRRRGPLILLTATKHAEISHAAVLARVIGDG